jgi:hypothetical protein
MYSNTGSVRGWAFMNWFAQQRDGRPWSRTYRLVGW